MMQSIVGVVLLLSALLQQPVALADQTMTMPQYNYDPSSDRGPENWGFLNVADNQCDGYRNSPIAISNMQCTKEAEYDFRSGNCRLQDMDFFINNYSVGARYDTTNCIPPSVVIPRTGPDRSFDDGQVRLYEVTEFMIHLSSGHTIGGEHFGAELQVMHRQAERQDRENNQNRNPTWDAPDTAVLSMMIEPSNIIDNRYFQFMLSEWRYLADTTARTCNPSESSTPAFNTGNEQFYDDGRDEYNVYRLLYFEKPDFFRVDFFQYEGSLTTPPCTEDVWWQVASEPVSISVRQYFTLANLILTVTDPQTCTQTSIASKGGSTSRPPQELNGRYIERICVDASAAASTVRTMMALVTVPVLSLLFVWF